jgi:hypothetical protein
MAKRYVVQLAFLDNSKHKYKGQGIPFFKQGWPCLKKGASLGLEKAMEVDEAMKWVLARGGIKGIVTERDALRVTLKKMQT